MKLKFWKKSEANPSELEELKLQVAKLQAISLLKDESYLVKHLEAENFKKSAYTTFAAIALAHGGQYHVQDEFIQLVGAEDFTGKLSIEANEAGVQIEVVEAEGE